MLCSMVGLSTLTMKMPNPLPALSKAYVCGRSRVGMAGWNPKGGMDVCLLQMLCVVR